MSRKVFVEVHAVFNPAGCMMPKSIVFENGKKYDVLRVTQVIRAAALKAGGAGIRYTCQIGRAQSYLFYDDSTGQWFVEARE